MKEIESRQIRVFISSTFRDMKEERDHLVKFTFPQLRKLCESRGVVWGEVDLRWGVTDEQKAEGKVLPICLEEIKRCRPYFIGLLGERYGWIPDAIPPEIIEREPWLAEHVRGRKSVTELEILHGVLNNPEMAEHAFFYFRDPAYVDSLPPSARKDFTVESVEDAKRLQDLKGRIRASGFPVREEYPDPKALGDLVMADLTAVIDSRWPEGSQPDPLDREAMDHEAYAQSRERVYIGRAEYFAKLDAHVDSSSDQPPVILGESGCGKSALLANWAKHYREAHPDTLVLQHYIGATPYSTDWAAMLRRIMGEFKRHMEIREDIPDKPDTLRSTFPNWLHMAAAKGRIVLVLDALNQLEDRDGAPDLVWLPPVMPENLRLIVSTLPGRPLDEIKKRAWPTLEVEPLTQTERERLIGEYLAQYAKTLSPARVQRIAATPQSTNALYLRVLLDELRFVRSHEELEERISYYLQAESPGDLYRKVIARWEQDYGTGTTLVGDTLSLLWAARRGLSETELLEALGNDGQPLPLAVWSPLHLAMSDAVVNRGGLLTFAHDFLRTAARDAYLPTEARQQATHSRLADYFEAQIGPREAGLLGHELTRSLRKLSITPRVVSELPWQLAEMQAWNRLYHLLADSAYLAVAWPRARFEVVRYWGLLEARSTYRVCDAYGAVIREPLKCNSEDIWTVGGLLAETGHQEEALAVWRYVSASGEHRADSRQVLPALISEARSLLDLSRWEEAMELLTEGERLARESGDKHNLAVVMGNQAVAMYCWKRYEDALRLNSEAERLVRELGDRARLAVCLGNRGDILALQGDRDRADSLFAEEERLAREVGDLRETARSLRRRARWADSGDRTVAAERVREAEQIVRDLGHKPDLIEVLEVKGHLLLNQGDCAGAEATICNAEKVARSSGLAAKLRDDLRKMAFDRMNDHDASGAMVLYTHVARLLAGEGDARRVASLLSDDAQLMCSGRMSYAEGAAALFQMAATWYEESGSPKEAIHCILQRAEIQAEEVSSWMPWYPACQRALDIAVANGLREEQELVERILAEVRTSEQGDR
jgi:tetratricopeptide (TPR) repeat protein